MLGWRWQASDHSRYGLEPLRRDCSDDYPRDNLIRPELAAIREIEVGPELLLDR